MPYSFVFYSNIAQSPWGGSEELWSQAAIRLHKMGHRVAASVKGWSPRHPRIQQLVEAGVQMQERWPASLTARVLRKAGLLVRTDADFCLQHNPDLVLISHGSHIPEVALCDDLRRKGQRHALLFQMATEIYWPADDLLGELERALHGAQANFFVARKNAELVERQLGSAVPHCEYIWNPTQPMANPARVVPRRPVMRSEDAAWSIACVARLDTLAKGHDVLFEVLRQSRWRARNLHVSLYGTGQWEQGLRRLAKYWNISQVSFRGHTEDIQSVWEEHDAIILPSRYEGTPLALIEAMLCGRPAIVTNVGGNAELIEEGKTGFVAGSCSLENLDAAMERAWQKRDCWSEMGVEASETIRSMMPADPVEEFVRRLLQLARPPDGNA